MTWCFDLDSDLAQDMDRLGIKRLFNWSLLYKLQDLSGWEGALTDH